MKHAPHSVSWDEELDAIIIERSRALHMTVSEYVRKCIRDERAHALHRKAMAAVLSEDLLTV